MFLGIDACTAGWYAVRKTALDSQITGKEYARFSDILADALPTSVITVDIPIGLRKVARWQFSTSC